MSLADTRREYAEPVASEITPAGITVHVLTVSDRSFGGQREDRSGPAAIEALEQFGFLTEGPFLIPDGRSSVTEALGSAVEDGVDVILTLGGTGVGPRDLTPEGTAPMLGQSLPGVADGIRSAGSRKVPTAVLSRGMAGLSRPSDSGHRCVIVNLPGSPGGTRDGISYLAPLLPHLLDQVRGGDH